MSDKPENPKKTGLGNLLLQRTSPPTEPSRPAAAIDPAAAAQPTKPAVPETGQGTGPAPSPRPRPSVEPTPSPGETSPRRRVATKRKRLRLRIRRTLHLEEDLDEQLSAVAGIERRERSEVVNDLLRKHLRKYEVIVKK